MENLATKKVLFDALIGKTLTDIALIQTQGGQTVYVPNLGAVAVCGTPGLDPRASCVYNPFPVNPFASSQSL